MRFVGCFSTIVVSVFLLFLVSCTPPTCEVSGDVQLNATFYRIENNTVKDTLVGSFELWLGQNFDTIYYDASLGKTQSLSFPLSPSSDTTQVIIKFNETIADTLSFFYTRNLTMVSHECGFVYYYDLKSTETTTHQIKSVWVSKALVEYGTVENIKIYL